MQRLKSLQSEAEKIEQYIKSIFVLYADKIIQHKGNAKRGVFPRLKI
jgi:hypothetical protein